MLFGQQFEECGRTLEDHDPIENENKDNLNEVLQGEFPHMCTMFTEHKGFNVFIGGASLISANQVLTLATAVHQMRNFTLEEAMKAEETNKQECEESHDIQKEIFVSCGDIDLQNNNDPEKQTSRVSKILVHPEYNPRSLTNDLAVLVLETPFKFTANVGRVCLPGPRDAVQEDVKCVASGHGRDTFKFGQYSSKLRKVKLPIVNSNECEEALNDKHFSKHLTDRWAIDNSHLCAGGVADADTCEGDGGGPLVCLKQNVQPKGPETQVPDNEDNSIDEEDDLFGSNNDEDSIFDAGEVDLRNTDTRPSQIVQVGVIAWGIKCGMEGLPSVYSSVIDGRCWLDQIMSCYNQDRTAFTDTSDASDFDIRGVGENPESVGLLSIGDCGTWLDSEESKRAACGCKQILNEDDSDATDYDLRSDNLDLRTVEDK